MGRRIAAGGLGFWCGSVWSWELRERRRLPSRPSRRAGGGPVVVIPPTGGWDTPQGQSVKWALRTAEREVSLTHQGIHGRDVVFLYAPVTSQGGGLEAAPPSGGPWGWEALLCFATGDLEAALVQACAGRGPSLVLAGGGGASAAGSKGASLALPLRPGSVP